MDPLRHPTLPEGIRSRFVEDINGLTMHLLEAGEAGRPALLLLHGFPELAYSWRKVMLPLAEMGFHVIAPDQRGYGRTTGWDDSYDADLRPFAMLNLIRDQLALLGALGIEHVHAVIGHDFGSPVAAHCALVRPDVFRRVALMSAPHAGAPRIGDHRSAAVTRVSPALAALPRPRKHYHWHYAQRGANGELMACPQGLHAFFRAYYHHKSGDWAGNDVHPLKGWTAEELAKLPTYYVMDLAETMPETVAHEMPSPAQIAACAWMTEAEMAVYAQEYGRSGFQGGLNWYRTRFTGTNMEMEAFAGRRIDVPATFIGGARDWGIHQGPGALEAMATTATSDWRGTHLVPGAGHWVQQEKPEETVALLRDFLR
ncbi:alpha/beta fold hydrolase [Neoroseomonas oryzicola]|uniref:Alpha/beta hydrolase n=1 Tax=Neoroseomonas oryzicola TaxID=535904 RepID=A0A9X9WQ47_9PROT|nr:alpha/beta hydrolase [Neoroseomonas oryzicola]MBR0662457.1 alpha/beta hydrolase [Neoroseomonas oryzicola]NKE19499.1 alpha/beta hydrolase [Neoroseomonas oryzicola]